MHYEASSALEAYNIIFGAIQPYFWFYLVFSLAITAGLFLISHYFLKNKLNLE